MAPKKLNKSKEEAEKSPVMILLAPQDSQSPPLAKPPKRARGRPLIHKKDENGKAIIELDEHGKRVIPKQKYKQRARKGELHNEDAELKSTSPPKSTLNPKPKLKPLFKPKALPRVRGDRKNSITVSSPKRTPAVNGTSSEAGSGPAIIHKLAAIQIARITQLARKKHTEAVNSDVDEDSATELELIDEPELSACEMEWVEGEEEEFLEIARRREDSGIRIDNYSDLDPHLRLEEESSGPPQSPDSAITHTVDVVDEYNAISCLKVGGSIKAQTRHLPPPTPIMAIDSIAMTQPAKQERAARYQASPQAIESMQVGDPSGGYSLVDRQWFYANPPIIEVGATGMFENCSLIVQSGEPIAPWRQEKEEIPHWLALNESPDFMQSEEIKDLKVYFGLEDDVGVHVW